MAQKINYYWRLFATATAFAGFGVVGVILAFVLFLPLRLLPGTRLQKSARTQRIIHKGYQIFLGYMQLLGIAKIHIEGKEKLQTGTHLIVANHPTLLDIVLLISAIPEVDCIVKSSAWKNPFFWGVLYTADYIRNDDPVELINTCVERLASGRSLIIFPEGTRSLPDRLQKFKRGAATIALRTSALLTPVTISCIPSTLTKAEKWYEIPNRPFVLSMKVGEPIDVQAVTKDSHNHLLAARQLTQYMEHYFLAQRTNSDECA